MGATAKDVLAIVLDEPRWVETRSLLLRGEFRQFGSIASGGIVVVSTRTSLAMIIGKPTDEVVARAVRGMPTDVELLVVPEALEHVQALLPRWRIYAATLHILRDPLVSDSGGHDCQHDVEVIERVDVSVLRQLPEELAAASRGALMIAAKRVGDSFVTVCQAASITETWWDVGVDTLPGYRRQGHARDCYLALARRLALRGRQPVWGALDSNAASLAMARSLGFEPTDRLYILMRPS